MIELLKSFAKQILPHGVCEYSIRRHDYIRQGFKPSRANWTALSVRRYRAFCDARLNLLPKEITRSLRTCVDAGAHVGSWTLALLDLFTPERVIALECEPRLVDHLRKKLASFPRVEVVDAALGESDGTATFNQLRHPAGSSLLRPRLEITNEYEARSWDVIGQVKVRKIAYDHLVAAEKEVSVLKLDVQGAEMSVLANSKEGLQKTSSIILEANFTPHYDQGSVFPELHQVMTQKGFGLYRLSPVYHRGRRALFADAIYVREDILRNLS